MDSNNLQHLLSVRVLHFIFILGVFTSCGHSKYSVDDVVGKYCWIGDLEGLGSIELRSDSTFHYSYKIGLLDIGVDGKWKLANDFIFLSSEYQNGSEYHKYGSIKTETKSHEGLEIVVNDTESQPIPATNFIAYSKSDSIHAGLSDMNGRIYLDRNDVDSISVGTFGILPFNYKIPDGINYLEIELINLQVLLHYRYFNNEKWKLNKKGILDIKWKQNYMLKNCS